MKTQYNADLYHLFNGTRSIQGDIEWYVSIAEKHGGPILELGSGTGRTLLPIARKGIEIHGLEYDSGMFEKLQNLLQDEDDTTRENTHLHQGDMRNFSIDKTFEIIQIPFRAFLHCLTREDQLDCLQCCRRHLNDGGILTFNLFHPSLYYMGLNHGHLHGLWRLTNELSFEDGSFALFSEQTTYDTALQRLHSKHRIERFDPDGLLTQTFVHRLELAYLYEGDLRALLSEAGFTNFEIFGGFERKPFTKDGQELVVFAIKND